MGFGGRGFRSQCALGPSPATLNPQVGNESEIRQSNFFKSYLGPKEPTFLRTYIRKSY